jgi:ATP-dependent DNA ligase
MPQKQPPSTEVASFIETMDCLPVSKLPEGPQWTYEIELDGYRLEVVQRRRETTLYSRRQNVFNKKFPHIAAALSDLPDDTVIDGEVVAIGPDGRPDFNLLHNFRSAESRIHYYAFDILMHQGRLITGLPLSERRKVLSTVVESGKHVALSQVSDRSAVEMLKFVKSHDWRVWLQSAQTASTSLVSEAGSGANIGSTLGKSSWSVDTCPAIWGSIPLWWASTVTRI